MPLTRLAIIALLTAPLWANLPNPTRFNVETTSGASNTNGGGYDPAQAGIDYSQSGNNSGSCSPFVTIDNSTVVATVTGDTITFVSGHTVTVANEKGNIVNYISGTGSTGTFGRYVIQGTSTTSTWKLDRTTGASAAAVITSAKMGGCGTLDATFNNAWGDSAGGATIAPIVYVKAGTYTLASTLNITRVNNGSGAGQMYGYNASQGDCSASSTWPLIQIASPGVMFNLNAAQPVNWFFSCLNLDNQNGTGVYALFNTVNGYLSARWITVINLGTDFVGGFSLNGGSGNQLKLYGVNVTGGGTHSYGAACTGLLNCEVTNSVFTNLNYGVYFNANIGGNHIYGNIFHNSGATACIHAGSDYTGEIINNTFDGCVLGIDFANGFAQSGAYALVINNIFSNSTTAAINGTGSQVSNPLWDCNGYFNNTANFSNGAVAGSHDVALGSSPYTTPGSDFSLNAVSNGGTLLKGAGCPSAFVGFSAIANHPSIGAYVPASGSSVPSVSVISH